MAQRLAWQQGRHCGATRREGYGQQRKRTRGEGIDTSSEIEKWNESGEVEAAWSGGVLKKMRWLGSTNS